MRCLSFICGLFFGAAVLSAQPKSEPTYNVEVEYDAVYAVADGYWAEAPESTWGRSRLLFRRSDSRQPLELKLDIYLPADDTSHFPRPLLLVMHGGAFFLGHKAEIGHVEWCRHFASLGYVAVSMDYRLGFPVDKPGFARAEQEAVEDAGNALQYLLEREDLGIDPDQVYLAGTSAGAAAMLALAYGGQAPGCRIRAVANLWGYMHKLEELENACIPILSYQSERDPVVPYREGYPMGMRFLTDKFYGTLAVYERATALGIPCEHHPCPEKRHRLQMDKRGALTPRFYEIRDRMAAFFAAAGQDP